MSCEDSCECQKFGIDYYGALGITREASELEVKKAFRRAAINNHPRRGDRPPRNLVPFSLVTEAYDVLSDPLRRAVYDQFGEEGLKRGAQGLPDYARPYVYHGDPMRTYREFFGSESAYADLLYSALDCLAHPEGRGARRKEEALVQPLPLTLSEVFFGGIKKMKIQREGPPSCLDAALGESVLTIPIKPGLPTGTEILFAGEGDQGPSKIPGDIVFVTEDRPHETFVREGANLSMTVEIFLPEALVGTVVTVNTLDERTLRVPVTSIVTPGFEKLVKGEGLPLPDNPEGRGDLVIKFEVEFPVYLPLASKNYIKKAFEFRGGRTGKSVDDDVPLRRERKKEIEQLEL